MLERRRAIVVERDDVAQPDDVEDTSHLIGRADDGAGTSASLNAPNGADERVDADRVRERQLRDVEDDGHVLREQAYRALELRGGDEIELTGDRDHDGGATRVIDVDRQRGVGRLLEAHTA